MASMSITDACGKVWNMPLLSIEDALDILPCYEEVFGLLSDLGLQEQLGLVSLVMQQPVVRVALGKMLGLLKDFANTRRESETHKLLMPLLSQGLNDRDMQIEALQMEKTNIMAAAFSDLAACQATIASLQQQLQAYAQGATPGTTQEQSAALALARSQQAETERTALEMAAAAAAAQQKSESLEAAMDEQEDLYNNEIACLNMQLEQVQADMTTAKEEANAEAATSKKLQERLEQTEAQRDSLAAALTAEEEARAKAERSLACNQRMHGNHVAGLGLYAQLQTNAKEATEEENRLLRARLSCMEERLRRHGGSEDHPSGDDGSNNYNHISADPTAAASSGAGTRSAGAPEQTIPQATEAARESLPEILSAHEELLQRQSVPVDILTSTDGFPSLIPPASPPAAAPSSADGVAAGASEQSPSQEEEYRSPEVPTTTSVVSAAPIPATSSDAELNSIGAAPQHSPVKKPGRLVGAVISGAALATVLPQVTFKLSMAAAGYMWTSAARAVIPSF